ncbi:hypothetical protein [Thiorhodovibrio winogradskyi]|nr:hypothetical protein [Thiorhodovibrio winogradskyi]
MTAITTWNATRGLEEGAFSRLESIRGIKQAQLQRYSTSAGVTWECWSI